MKIILNLAALFFGFNALANNIAQGTAATGAATQASASLPKSKAPLQVFVSVHALTPESATQVCRASAKGLSAVTGGRVDCYQMDQSSVYLESFRAAQQNQTHAYHLQIFEVSHQKFQIRVQNWTKEDELEFRSVDLTFLPNTDPNLDSLKKIEHLTQNLAHYHQRRNMIKIDLMLSALNEFSEILRTDAEGVLVDAQTGSQVYMEQAYNLLKQNGQSRVRNYLRAGMEIVATLGFAWLDYRNNPANKVDWDYDSFWTSLKAKIVTGKGASLEDNSFGTNLGHAFAGMFYYQIGRDNGFTKLESLLFTWAASAAWESVLEYREVFSINDQLITSLAGAVIGEVFYKVSLAIRQKSDSTVAKVFAALLNPIGALNSWLDKKNLWMAPKNVGGMDTTLWSNMELGVGAMSYRVGGKSTAGPSFSAKAEVCDIPGYGEPGKYKVVLDSESCDLLQYQGTRTPDGSARIFENYDFLVKTALKTYYSKDLRKDKNGQLSGHEILLSLSSGFEASERLALEPDFYANLHILGGSLVYVGHRKGYQFRLEMEVFQDFAMVKSMAMEPLVQATGSAGLPTVLQNYAYYYAYGNTAAIAASISKGRLSLGARYSRTQLDEMTHNYRFQEAVTRATEFSEELQKLEGHLDIRVRKNLKLRLVGGISRHEGNSVQGFSASRTEKYSGVYLIYHW